MKSKSRSRIHLYRLCFGNKESEDKNMYKQLAELSVTKSADYYDKVVKALEDAGFVIVLKMETSTDKYYIIAEKEEDKE